MKRFNLSLPVENEEAVQVLEYHSANKTRSSFLNELLNLYVNHEDVKEAVDSAMNGMEYKSHESLMDVLGEMTAGIDSVSHGLNVALDLQEEGQAAMDAAAEGIEFETPESDQGVPNERFTHLEEVVEGVVKSQGEMHSMLSQMQNMLMGIATGATVVAPAKAEPVFAGVRFAPASNGTSASSNGSSAPLGGPLGALDFEPELEEQYVPSETKVAEVKPPVVVAEPAIVGRREGEDEEYDDSDEDDFDSMD